MKNDQSGYFRNKKILIMGLGLLGRGIGLVRFLHQAGAKLTVTDLKPEAELIPALEQLRGLSGIEYVLGGHRYSDFYHQDMIIRAPNVPLDSFYLYQAKQNKIPVEMDASLFCRLAPSGVSIIGVTGTRGKSTVTQMLYDILKQAGRRVFLGGNVRGLATLPLLGVIRAGDLVLLELDSWQLQGFGESRLSPDLAVFTNFFPDHLDYYKGDMERYFADKVNIFKFQSPESRLLVGRQVAGKIRRANPPGRVLEVTGQDLPAEWVVGLPGEHNRYNAALAYLGAKELGVEDQIVRKTLEDHSGLPGRMEYLGKRSGVFYYNDNNATSPEAVIAAVRALEAFKGRIIVIGGGADKGLDYTEYGQIVPQYAKALVLFTGGASVKIQAKLPSSCRVETVSSMPQALGQAQDRAEPGDVIILSPGASSFGVFVNEYDRNDQYLELVNNIE